MSRRPSHLARALRVLGLAAAMLALVGRFASAMVVADPQALGEAAAVLAAAVPCQADGDTGGGHHRGPASDPDLVVLEAFLSQPSPILTPAIVPPPPRQSVVRVAAILPPARAPPAVRSGAALPRGPPVLV